MAATSRVFRPKLDERLQIRRFFSRDRREFTAFEIAPVKDNPTSASATCSATFFLRLPGCGAESGVQITLGWRKTRAA